MSHLLKTIILLLCIHNTAPAIAADQREFGEVITQRYIVAMPQQDLSNRQLLQKISLLTNSVSLTIESVFCTANGKIITVVPAEGQANYLGDFVVELSSNCGETADALKKQWGEAGFEVFIDGSISAPMPYVSGNN